jgi:hypothetical protein
MIFDCPTCGYHGTRLENDLGLQTGGCPACAIPLTEDEYLRGAELAALPVVGRNDPCPCGSGRKFKKCHGA